jgi:hypothetical protein
MEEVQRKLGSFNIKSLHIKYQIEANKDLPLPCFIKNTNSDLFLLTYKDERILKILNNDGINYILSYDDFHSNFSDEFLLLEKIDVIEINNKKFQKLNFITVIFVLLLSIFLGSIFAYISFKSLFVIQILNFISAYLCVIKLLNLYKINVPGQNLFCNSKCFEIQTLKNNQVLFVLSGLFFLRIPFYF